METKDRNKNCLKPEYGGHIKIRNWQQIYLKIQNPSKRNAKVRVPKNLYWYDYVKPKLNTISLYT